MADEEADRLLKNLQKAVQEIVNHRSDRPAVVREALVVWEQVILGEDGTSMHRFDYSIASDAHSLAGSLGLAGAALSLIEGTVFGEDDDD